MAFCGFSCNAQQIPDKDNDGHIVLFYNVQNLFHPDDDPHTNDNDFTPEGSKGYTTEIYRDRINRIGSVLRSVEQSLKGELLIAGLAEVENEKVLQDLCENGSPSKFSFIHRDSPDPRGIDVALIYNKNLFTPDTHFVAAIDQPYKEGNHVPRTRDMLFVVGHTEKEKFIISVNHWPSRRGGVEKTSHKRILAADICRKVANSLINLFPKHMLIIMGDLNDNPGDKSERTIRGVHRANDSLSLINPFEDLYKTGKGSYVYRNNWNMYDQIMVSPELNIKTAGVYKDRNLVYSQGSKKGTPKRSFEGHTYINGYSDHLPVYIIIGSVSPQDQKY